MNQSFVSAVASKRNHIPRKSLNYQTPLEAFLSYINTEQLSRLISQIINHKIDGVIHFAGLKAVGE